MVHITGQVVDAKTREPLGVIFNITNIDGGRGWFCPNGVIDITVSLTPGRDYHVVITREDYQDIEDTINVANDEATVNYGTLPMYKKGAPPPKPPIFPRLREILYPWIPGVFDRIDQIRRNWGFSSNYGS